MKFKLILASLLLVSLSNCGPKAEPKGENNIQTCDDLCQAESVLKASYISGHLGNYNDCPDEGYSSTAPDGVSADFAAGDCDGDQCGILNCEKASAILRLSNGGDDDVQGVLVQKIELKDVNGTTLANLPLEAVTLVDNNQTFGGIVKVDESPSIRIDFQGPANPYELYDDSAGDVRRESPFVLHITLSADNAQDVLVISPAISVIPSVDT